METSLKDYYDMLNKHDWWYQMSDDSSVYHKGREEQARLISISRDSDEHAQLFNDFQAYKLASDPNNQPPKPERPNT